MMRSMFSAVSGLRVHQTKMDVIAHNIANVNTVGYKSSRVTFSEVFSQTVGGASGANPVTERGGVNPMQIGLGASVASIDKLMTTGASERTDNPLDVMIQGDGFFIVGDTSGNYFTRAGAMNVDEEGNLVNAMGLKVMGWDTAVDKKAGSPTVGQYIVEPGVVKPIQIMGDKESVGATATENIKMQGNLNAYTTPIKDGTIDFYDTVGNRYVVDVQYKYNAASVPSSWNMFAGNLAYPNGDKTKTPYNVDVANTGTLTLSKNVSDPLLIDPLQQKDTGIKMEFNSNGDFTKVTGGNPSNVTAVDGLSAVNLTIAVATGVLVPEATFGNGGAIKINFAGISQYGNNSSANAKAVMVDGNKSGTLIGMQIGTDGIITGRYSNGELRKLAQIAVARFANPGGLEKVGDNLFVATANSGDFDGIGEEVQSGGGKMMGGVLEMSNVDLSAEFTSMITTQRGFQANSRVITTSDDMLQELVNLKR